MSRPRTLLPVGVVALLVLLGCGGGPSVPEPGSEAPPADPPTPEPAPASILVEPPGIETFDPQVREQYLERRRAVERSEAEDASKAIRAEAWGDLGTWYLAYQHLQLAEPVLERARQLAPDDLRWLYYSAHLARVQGWEEEARELLERVLVLRPDDVPTRVWLGRVAREAGDPAAARRRFEEALARDPGNLAARLGLGRLAVDEGRWETAVRHLEAVAGAAPEATDWRYPLGVALSRLGREAEAAPLLEAASLPRGEQRAVPLVDPLLAQLDATRIDEGVLLTRARRLADEGRWREAVAVLPTQPTSAGGLRTSFTILHRAGATERACGLVPRLREVAPGERATRVFAAVCAEEAGDLARAEELYREVLREDPEARLARQRLAALLERTGRSPEPGSGS